ncbi:MAG: hypothetical protein IKL79_06130 [Clostridia bacterium]|nr:hypothetical protein [Clostridia bacterium]
MKRFLAILLLLCVALGALSGCKRKKYKPVESTAEEARVILTLSANGRSYDVKYELYRALFLTYKSEIDGGDASVWTGEKKDDFINEINKRIISEAAKIFAVFELCERLGIDLYTDEVEDEIYDMIRVSVEGGSWGENTYLGFDGDYEAYLDSLKSMYHNYSTSVLLMRYQIGRRLLDSHYIGGGTADDGAGKITDGAIEYDRETVLDFYSSHGASLILTTFVSEQISYTPRELAEDIRLDVIEAAKSGVSRVRAVMIGRGSPTEEAELESGRLVSRYSLSREYEELGKTAAELSAGEVGEIVETVSAEDGRRYYIIYKMEKSEEFFEENYATVVLVYLCDAVGEAISMAASTLKEGATFSEAYANIIHSEVHI